MRVESFDRRWHESSKGLSRRRRRRPLRHDHRLQLARALCAVASLLVPACSQSRIAPDASGADGAVVDAAAPTPRADASVPDAIVSPPTTRSGEESLRASCDDYVGRCVPRPDADDNRDECYERSGCFAGIFAAEAIEPLAACLSDRACDGDDDECLLEVATSFDSPIVDECLRHMRACVEPDGDDDSDECPAFGLLRPELQAQMSRCFSGGCGSYEDCVRSALEPACGR